MAFSMSDSLSNDTADYTSVELDVMPQETMSTMPSKNQIVLLLADGSQLILNINDNNNFTVDISINDIAVDDGETVMDFWISKTKGNGLARTFYWVHPTDGWTYVARFLAPPTFQQYSDASHQGIANMKLFINARKAPAPVILLEDGTGLLLEDGGSLLME